MAGTTTVVSTTNNNERQQQQHRKWRRIHGFQLPLHTQQLVAWGGVSVMAFLVFGVLVPCLTDTSLQTSMQVAYGALFAVHIAAHLAAVVIDPADPNLRAKETDERRPVPALDRSKCAHVIECGRCHLCEIRVTDARTKHCGVCNKCVARFDHHCRWLNHCVGRRNYGAFFVCLFTAVVGVLGVLSLSVTVLVLYHAESDQLARFVSDGDQRFRLARRTVSDAAFLAVTGCGVVVSAAAVLLLVHLLIFHLYIMAVGITTYEYIRYGADYRSPRAPSGGGQARQRKRSRAASLFSIWQQHRSTRVSPAESPNKSIPTIDGTLTASKYKPADGSV